MTQHTPGPWHVGVKQAEKIIYDASGWAVANATVYHGENDAKANARLIAAAPDLLEALKTLQSMASTFPNELHKDHPDVVAARAAIARATGDNQ